MKMQMNQSDGQPDHPISQVSFRLPTELMERLRHHTAYTVPHVSMTHHVIQALEDYLSKHSKEAKSV